MATKIKGIFKGIKFISQIFVFKEHEMEIGYPTDVRHVAHIGWDSTSVNPPTWMNDFKTTSDFSSTSVSSLGETRDTNCAAISSWGSQDFQQARGFSPVSRIFADSIPTDLPKIPKKTKRKHTKESSHSSSSSRSSTRSSKSKSSFDASMEIEGEQDQIGVS